MTVTLWACTECGVFYDSPNDLYDGSHWYHHCRGITSDDYESASRAAAAHLVLSRRIQNGTVGDGLTGWAMNEARTHADWFSAGDAVYDKEPS